MKKFVTIFLVLFTILPVSALSFSLGADLRSVDSFFLDGIRIDAECGFEIENFKIIIPIRYGNGKYYNLSLIETGILVSVHPWEGLGLFAEASLVKTGFLWGIYAPDEPVFFSAEGSVGWEFFFGNFYIRPKYTYRSSLSGEDVKEERIKVIPQFGESRISVHTGITFGGKK